MENFQASGERCSWSSRSLLADGDVVNKILIAGAQFLIFLVESVPKVSSAIICVNLEMSLSCLANMVDMTLSSSMSIRS